MRTENIGCEMTALESLNQLASLFIKLELLVLLVCVPLAMLAMKAFNALKKNVINAQENPHDKK